MIEKVDKKLWSNLYRAMVSSRKSEELEKALAQQAEIFFYVPGAGHEVSAVLAPHLLADDWLHLHYRDRALALARGVSLESFLYTALGKNESSSGGRRMPGFVSDPNLNILSGATVVGNSALQSAGVAAAVKEHANNPLVLCSVGDGTTQQGEFMEAIAETVRSKLPVLFLIENNNFALSTPTRGNTFFSTPDGDVDTFFGLPIQRVNGLDAMTAYETLGGIVADIRTKRTPQIVLFEVERLSSHTNADDESVYRNADEIKRLREKCDPVKNLRATLLESGFTEAELLEIEDNAERAIHAALEKARAGTEPAPEYGAKRPLPARLNDPESEYRSSGSGSLTMLESMRAVLELRLAGNDKVTLYGEDIEDPKGDVFGLTQGLSSKFPLQVKNSALSESTIVGTAIGRALTGERPVALLQFADFMPLAYNQLISELGSLFWRTKGEWNAPVIVMAICGAYRPGLGPFHAQTPDSAIAHIPGIDLFMPSTATDAAGMLNAAFESDRPSVFLYPKNLINDRDIMTTPDVARQFVPIGRARTVRTGNDITLVSWGGTMPLCEKAAAALEDADISAEVIDLRSLFPWDADAVIASAEKTDNLVVIHEDNRTCGIGGEILATIAERCGSRVNVTRVTRSDTYVPYHFGTQMEVLPSFKSLLEKIAQMLKLKITWRERLQAKAGMVTINAIGSSPSDETIHIIELHVDEGDTIAEGDLLASVEADKATMDISSPVAGTVEKLFAQEGDSLRVGAPLIEIAAESASIRMSSGIHDPGLPVIEKREPNISKTLVASSTRIAGKPVLINSICSTVGSRRMHNDEFLDNFPDWSSEDVKKRTGIEQRYWIGEGESALTLAVSACKKLLKQQQLDVSNLDMIICATGTPPSAMTPSLACRILKELSPETGETLVQAYDINAACTGWLYALQTAYDTLKYDARRKIMVVTTETLSPILDRTDPETAFIFGDASTATLLSCEHRESNIQARLHRPVLSAMGVEEDVLRVPFMNSGEFVGMKGMQVFRVAVRKMVAMLQNACTAENVAIDDLDMIVTHQANERIIDAARKMIKFKEERVFNQMRNFGNTSSNTIPIALQTVIPAQKPSGKVGLTAFGGGYTFGAAVIEVI